MMKRVRVLLSKLGLDGHDRGIQVIAAALRDAGMEVIYLGRHNSVESIVQTAVQEDVDVVGLSSLADAHRVLAPKIVRLLQEAGKKDVKVVLGGFIQPEDVSFLKEAGVAGVFATGSKLDDIVAFIKTSVAG